MGNELKIAITADSSELASGLADASSQVNSAASKMAEAQGKATAATKALAEAQTQLGASAAAGNAQAQQILVQYTAEAAAATAAVKDLTAAESENAAAAEVQAVATNAAGAAAGHAVPQFAAASGAIRVLEGNMTNNVRAAERFLTTTLGLGPVLQKAFPVVGALALGGVLFELIKNAVDFSEKASDLAAELNTDWLTGAIGQMTGLAKATEEADKQIEKFAADNDAAKNKLAEAAVQQARLQAELANPGARGAQAGAIAADNVRAAQIQKRIDALEREKELATQAAKAYGANASSSNFADEHGSVGIVEQRKLQEQAIAEYKSAELEQTSLIAEKENLILQAEVQRAKIPRPVDDKLLDQLAKQAIETAHAADAGLEPAQKITEELQKQLALNLQAEQSADRQAAIERARAAAEGKPDEQTHGTQAEREKLRTLQDEAAVKKATVALDEVAHENIMRFFDEEQKASEEGLKKQAEYERYQAAEFKRDHEEQIALARQQADDTVRAAEEEFAFTEREIRYEAELGIISTRVAEQRLLAAQRLKETQTTGALSQEQALFNPALGEKQLAEYTALENRMNQEARKGALERQQITQQETLKIIQVYQRVAVEFNRDFTQALDAWITKSQTVGQAFARMFGELELQLINFVAEWALKKAEMWALDAALQVSGLAKQRVTQGAAAVAQVTSDAAVAAAGTMAYYSVINPPAAPALAAAAYAETIAYAPAAVFDTGGMLPSMQFAFNKSGSAERILSPGQTKNFESLVNNGGSRSATLNQTNHFGGGVSKEMLDDHMQKTMNALRRMIRPEALA